MLFVAKAIFTSLLIISVSHAQGMLENYCQQSSDYVKEYNRAHNSGEYFPQPKINSKEQAYLIQACIVSSKAQKIVGFKAGLINESSQEKFHIDEPVLGVFTKGNLKDSNIDIYESNKVSLIEVELAFRLKQKIDDLADLEKDIIELVDAVAPAIEIPLFHFENTSSLISNDIIAANVGANIFILGDFVLVEDVDIDSIEVSLIKNDEVIGRSLDADSINRWESLRWLIKKSYLEGYNLEEGTIYLTGSQINPVVMKRAMYQASYSQMKDITLIVK